MDYMAALAKGFKIFGPIIGGIMIEVSGRQHHLRYSNDCAVANESKNGAIGGQQRSRINWLFSIRRIGG